MGFVPSREALNARAVAAIAILAMIALFRFRMGMLWVLAGGAALGIVARTILPA